MESKAEQLSEVEHIKNLKIKLPKQKKRGAEFIPTIEQAEQIIELLYEPWKSLAFARYALWFMVPDGTSRICRPSMFSLFDWRKGQKPYINKMDSRLDRFGYCYQQA